MNIQQENAIKYTTKTYNINLRQHHNTGTPSKKMQRQQRTSTDYNNNQYGQTTIA